MRFRRQLSAFCIVFSLFILLSTPCMAAASLEEIKANADQGDVTAQYNLGVMFANGEGVTQDHAQAVRWYKKAAEQGHVNAQNNLRELQR